jgi:4-amino-4-deoxy-L-arabinose transferase-like glycosyltransferase
MRRGLLGRVLETTGTPATIISVSLVIGVFGFVYFYNLGGWLINDDEGTFLYQVWRVSEGDVPYEDLFTSRWPLFLYTGAGLMKLVGAETVPMRVFSVCLSLGTAVLVFLVAQRVQSAETALLSMVVFLMHPDIFGYGRSFLPEPFYVFFCTLGLYLFLLGRVKGRLLLLAVSGLTFVVASLYKPLAVLAQGGCLLFLGVAWLRGQGARHRLVLEGTILLVVYVVFLGCAVLLFAQIFPHFTDSVFGFHLERQELTPAQVVLNGLGLLLQYSIKFAPFLLIALPAAWQGWFGDRKMALLSWQLPTALAFLVLSRQLYPRLLIYLVPVLAILFAGSLEPVRRLQHRFLLLLCVVGSVLVPWIINDTQMLLRKESETLMVAEYVQTVTSPGACVLSDYQSLNLYARRPSTFSGAELSQFSASSGFFTGADLIAEIEAQGVQMVIVDVSPVSAQHMVSLPDYDSFYEYLQSNFELINVLVRANQRLEIYYRLVEPHE